MGIMESYRPGMGSHGGAPVLFGSRTDIGCIREQNEDSLVVKAPLFVVADGMGGHAAGEVASEIAVNTLAECAPEHIDVEALGRAVEQANRDIINAALAGEGREGMGTTCTAAMLEGNRLVIAQVGDSRAYLLQSGKLTQVTRDHSLMANMIDAGQITPEEARVHPNRSVITRALGNDPDTAPDLYQINVKDGDRLLICSDGLTSMIEDGEIQAVMNRVADPQECADMLVEGALAAGGLDNVTVIVADVNGQADGKLKGVALRTKLTAALVFLLLAIIIALTAWGGYSYLHNSAYLKADDNGMVCVYRGVPGTVMGFSYSELLQATDIPAEKLQPSARDQMEDGLRVGSVVEAYDLVDSYHVELAQTLSGSTTSESASTASAAASGAAFDAPNDYDDEDSSSNQTSSASGGAAQSSSSSGGQNR